MTTIDGTFGATIQGTLRNDDANTYKLSASSGGVLRINFGHPHGVGTTDMPIVITLMDALGNIEIKKTLYGNSDFVTTLPSAGDYFVKVADGNSYVLNDGGVYSLTPTLSFVAGSAYDGAVNNTPATAVVAEIGPPIIGTMNNGDKTSTEDVDVYKLRASAGGELTIDFKHPDGVGTAGNPIFLELLDQAGNSVIRKTLHGDYSLTTTVATGGEYYVTLSEPYPRGERSGVYTMTPTMKTAPGVVYDGAGNNDTAHALVSAMGSKIIGSLNNGDKSYGADIDVFKVSASGGGVLTLDFKHPDGAGTTAYAVVIAVLDSAGNNVVSKTVHGDETFSTTVSSAGDYYLQVSEVSPLGGEHSGIYSLTPTLNSVPGASYDGAANNNTANALVVTMGAPIYGGLNYSDVDVFRVHADKGGVMSLAFVHQDGGGTKGMQVTIDVLDASGHSVATKALNGSANFQATLAGAGDYYLKVSADSHDSSGIGKIYSLTPSLADGTAGATLCGSAGNDTFTTTSGDDIFIGNGGVDTLNFHGVRANYTISAAGATVSDVSGVDGTDTLINVARLHFSDQSVALDIDGSAGQVYRLYQTAFGRTPDASGLGFWISALDHGMKLHDVAGGLMASSEFVKLYGNNQDNPTLVTNLYKNVLHRAPDSAGLAWWVGMLDKHEIDVATAMLGFSESPENQIQVIGSISHGMVYVPHI
jgi:hypothetical protein